MKRLWALLLLAACAKDSPPPPQGDVPGLLRNPTAPLASQVDVTAERLKGDWFVRQSLGVTGWLGPKINIAPAADGRLVMTSETVGCADDVDLCQAYVQTINLIEDGQGRWQVSSASDGFPTDPLWVLWMEFDDRTVAIGGPTGKYVWIMDRTATGGGDRITAARDILKWYGYDVDKMSGEERQ